MDIDLDRLGSSRRRITTSKRLSIRYSLHSGLHFEYLSTHLYPADPKISMSQGVAKISKNPKKSTLKNSVQSSYSFRSVPARRASQAEKTMQQVVQKELAKAVVKR